MLGWSGCLRWGRLEQDALASAMAAGSTARTRGAQTTAGPSIATQQTPRTHDAPGHGEQSRGSDPSPRRPPRTPRPAACPVGKWGVGGWEAARDKGKLPIQGSACFRRPCIMPRFGPAARPRGPGGAQGPQTRLRGTASKPLGLVHSTNSQCNQTQSNTAIQTMRVTTHQLHSNEMT